MTTCGFSVPSKVQILYLHFVAFSAFSEDFGGSTSLRRGEPRFEVNCGYLESVALELIMGVHWRYNPLILTNPTGHSSGQVCCGVIYQVEEYIDIYIYIIICIYIMYILILYIFFHKTKRI